MPKPFRLQSVLDYRHSRVEALEVELGRLHNEREQRLALLENARARKTGLLAELGQAQTGVIDMALIHQLRAALERQETSITQQLQLLHKLQMAIEQKNRETITAKQDEQALQTLKNKNEALWQAELQLRESRLQDDIYIAQAYRRASQIGR